MVFVEMELMYMALARLFARGRLVSAPLESLFASKAVTGSEELNREEEKG